jgi:hypothetical protein
MQRSSLRCVAWIAVLCAAAALPAAAKQHGATPHDAGPRHNFVAFDLSKAVPKPLPALQIAFVALLDAGTAARDGDTVSFDELYISQNFQARRDDNTKKYTYRTWMVTQVERRIVSCAWRSGRTVRISQSDDGPVFIRPSTGPSFMGADTQYDLVIDTLCAGRKLEAASGATSIEAAVAMWKDQFQSPATFAMAESRAPDREKRPWMYGRSLHQFVPVLNETQSGNQIYLDRANLVRDGDTVTALSVVLLGPEAYRAPEAWQGVAMERNVRYDCKARTLTVLAQGTWGSDGRFLGQEAGETPSPRDASESPVAAGDIAAACGALAGDTPSFDSVESAWADGRTHWPAK